jgi:transposase
MRADAYPRFNKLYKASRPGGPTVDASCWAHARREFFDLARLQKIPIAIEAVERIDASFAIEREINGKPPAERVRVRNERSRPLVGCLGDMVEGAAPQAVGQQCSRSSHSLQPQSLDHAHAFPR